MLAAQLTSAPGRRATTCGTRSSGAWWPRTGPRRRRPMSRLVVELVIARAIDGDVVAELEIGPDWAAVRRGPAPLDAAHVPPRRPRARPPAAARTGAVTTRGGRARDPAAPRRGPARGPARSSGRRSAGVPTSGSPSSSPGSTTGTRSGRRRRWSRVDGDRIVGLRTFLRWEFVDAGRHGAAGGAGGRHRDRPRLPGSGDLPLADACARSTSSPPTVSRSCSTRRTPRAGPGTCAWDGSRSAGCRRRCAFRSARRSPRAHARRAGAGGAVVAGVPAGRTGRGGAAQTPGVRASCVDRRRVRHRACARTGRPRTCAGGTSSRRSATGR